MVSITWAIQYCWALRVLVRPASVCYHVSVDDVAWTCLEVWPLVAGCGPRCNTHKIDRAARMLRSTDLQALACYRALPDGFAIVRLPMHYILRQGGLR